MNGYVWYYRSKRGEVYAETSYEAQGKAAKAAGCPPAKSYEVSVFLAEKNGEPVVHSTAEVG